MITNEWIPGKFNIELPLSLRKNVFPDAEKDEYDDYAMHLVVYESDVPVASGRLYLGPGNVFYISHVGVIEEYRHKGIGDLTAKLLLYKGLGFAEKIYADIPEDKLSFFERYGFRKNGGKCCVSKDEVQYPSKCGRH